MNTQRSTNLIGGQRSEVSVSASLSTVALAKGEAWATVKGKKSESGVPPLPSLCSWLRWAGRRPSSGVRRPASCSSLLRTGIRRPSSVVCLRSAFTLVELLVVISIIAILLGIILPAYFSIREKARYTKTKVTVKNLETAFKAYLDQYRVWPTEFGSGENKEINADIVAILRGTDKNANKDGYVFYEIDATNSAGAYLDPYTTYQDLNIETPYRFRVDENYDNKITVDGQDLYRTVIVWSVGTNRTDPPGASATKEGNIKSWD